MVILEVSLSCYQTSCEVSLSHMWQLSLLTLPLMWYAASSLKSDIIFNFIIKIVTQGKSFMELHFQQHLVDWNLMKVTYAISVSDAKLIPI